jgi:phasin
MTKSPEVPAKKARTTHRKPSRKVAAEKASNIHRKKAPKVAAEKVRNIHRKAAAQIQEFRATQVPDSMPALAEKNVVDQFEEFRATPVRDSIPALAERSVVHQFKEVRATQVPDSMRALAERNVAQTRAVYQHFANAFQAVFECWEDSLDAAGQGAVALNHKIIDIAERNVSAGFDLAARLAGSKSLAEAMQVQAAYWRKQSGELRMQAEEVRVLLEKVTSSVVEPIKAQVTRDMDESIRRIRST